MTGMDTTPEPLALITVQQGVGRASYVTHLAGPGQHGGTGPTLCPWDRHARDDDGRALSGWSVGGGAYSGSITDTPCPECLDVAETLSPPPTVAGMAPSRVMITNALHERSQGGETP